MSQILINAYLSELDRIKRVSGSLSEQVIREAFKDLLKAWSRQQGLVFLAEQGLTSNQKTAIRPDGTILHDLRVPHRHRLYRQPRLQGDRRHLPCPCKGKRYGSGMGCRGSDWGKIPIYNFY